MKIIDINSIPRSQGHQEKEIGTALKKSRRKWYMIGFCLTSLAVVSCFWFFSLRAAKNFKAQDAIFQATYYFEAGDFDQALKGDADHKGFFDVIKAYPYTTTANLACFYAGVAYMHQKEYDQALAFLKQFKAKDFILQARAWCVMGDAYSEQKKHKEAAIYYMKAAHYKANSVYTPGYLVKAAIAFEADAQYRNAYSCYQEIITQYPTSGHGSSLAIKESSRLSGLF